MKDPQIKEPKIQDTKSLLGLQHFEPSKKAGKKKKKEQHQKGRDY